MSASSSEGGIGPGVTLRPATIGDCHRIWVWRNDPEARQASFSSDPIPYEAHEEWFRESLALESRRIYVIVTDGTDGGVVRLDVSGGEAVVSINMAPEQRHRGVGPLALSALADVAFGPLRLRRLVASIKPDNQASLAAFVKAGFALVSEPHAVTAIRTSGVR